MRNRKHCSQTIKKKHYQGNILEHDQTDNHNKQSYPQLFEQEQHHFKHNYNNLSVLTVEDPRTSKVKDSEPVYQTIEEISRGVSENKQNIYEKKSSEEKGHPNINNAYHRNINIIYGILTAKEMAKYRPCTPDIIRR
jgi:hypothetical protein